MICWEPLLVLTDAQSASILAFLFKKELLLFFKFCGFVCVCIWVCALSAGALGGQKQRTP